MMQNHKINKKIVLIGILVWTVSVIFFLFLFRHYIPHPLMYVLSDAYFDVIEVVDLNERRADTISDRFIAEIKNDIAELDTYSDFEKTCFIRDWAYNKIVYSGGIDTIDMVYSTRHTPEWNLMKFNETFDSFGGVDIVVDVPSIFSAYMKYLDMIHVHCPCL